MTADRRSDIVLIGERSAPATSMGIGQWAAQIGIMAQNTQLPWASGPAEILRHGLGLLNSDSQVNRRLAMILIDNAVELMIGTYLGLPRRVTGLSRACYSKADDGETVVVRPSPYLSRLTAPGPFFRASINS
jgi:hypothetical protein